MAAKTTEITALTEIRGGGSSPPRRRRRTLCRSPLPCMDAFRIKMVAPAAVRSLLVAAAWLSLLFATALLPAGARALNSEDLATAAYAETVSLPHELLQPPPGQQRRRRLAAAGGGGPGRREGDPVRFYVYEEKDMLCRTPPHSKPPPSARENYYLATQPLWQRDLADHPWRTREAKAAQLFIVPCDVERSVYAGDVDGETHLARIGRALDALEASEWYRQRGGSDHFWQMMGWQLDNTEFRRAVFPENRLSVIKNMIVGRYWNAPSPEVTATFYVNGWPPERPWRCSVTVPILTRPNLWRDETYAKWEARPNNLYFRGRTDECPHNPRAQVNRNLTQSAAWAVAPSIISGDHAATLDEYRQELYSARYCLVFACDDAHKTLFYDAVAAGCVPVVIDDHFRRAVAPFSRVVDYDAFTLTIPELDWRSNTAVAAKWILEQGDVLMRRMHASLLRKRRAFMWRDPHPYVATMGLRAIVQDCLRPPSERPKPAGGGVAPGGGEKGGGHPVRRSRRRSKRAHAAAIESY